MEDSLQAASAGGRPGAWRPRSSVLQPAGDYTLLAQSRARSRRWGPSSDRQLWPSIFGKYTRPPTCFYVMHHRPRRVPPDAGCFRVLRRPGAGERAADPLPSVKRLGDGSARKLMARFADPQTACSPRRQAPASGATETITWATGALSIKARPAPWS